jgi:hypothetical protein
MSMNSLVMLAQPVVRYPTFETADCEGGQLAHCALFRSATTISALRRADAPAGNQERDRLNQSPFGRCDRRRRSGQAIHDETPPHRASYTRDAIGRRPSRDRGRAEGAVGETEECAREHGRCASIFSRSAAPRYVSGSQSGRIFEDEEVLGRTPKTQRTEDIKRLSSAESDKLWLLKRTYVLALLKLSPVIDRLRSRCCLFSADTPRRLTIPPTRSGIWNFDSVCSKKPGNRIRSATVDPSWFNGAPTNRHDKRNVPGFESKRRSECRRLQGNVQHRKSICCDIPRIQTEAEVGARFD